MNALVESLSLLSKLDLEQMSFHGECVNLANLLQDWYQECTSRYEHTSTKLTVKCPQLVQVLTGHTHFIRVSDNLCQNSIKYRSENPVHIDATLECDKREYIFTSQDNGIRIDPSQAPRLFGSLCRSDLARSSKVKGNGLGFSIIKQIITQIKGGISASGELNKGPCITIRPPLLQGRTIL